MVAEWIEARASVRQGITTHWESQVARIQVLLRTLSQAAKESDRPIAALLFEWFRLRFSIGRIGISEYLDYRLHLNDITFQDKRAFGGFRAESVLTDILVDDYSRFISLDKITMYTLLEGYELPVPRLYAVYQSRRPTSLLSLNSPEALANYLATPGILPVYMKPSFGAFGRGNTLIKGIVDNALVLGDNTNVAVDAFCESLHGAHGLGWVLQEPLAPHSDITGLCGDKISGVRIHTFLSPSGPTITKAIWKINAGRDDSDNFCYGASGNMLAALDVQTGEVVRVISGTGLSQLTNPVHPLTKASLVKFRLPYWDEIKSLACEAQLAFPGYICPGWDIAICEDGPKILEVNFFGDIDLSQHAYRRGFLDQEFLSLMRSCGLNGLLYGSARRCQRSTKNLRLGRRKHHWGW